VPAQESSSQAQSGDPFDLLAGLSVSETPEAASVPVAAAAASGASDPFGGFSDLIVGGEEAAGGSQPGGGLKPRLVDGTVEGWYSKLCLSDKGILYQDQFLQIGVKADFQKAQGRIMLFLGNKHTEGLSNITVSIPPIPSYRIQVGNAPTAIAAQAQIQIPIAVACLEASLDVPKVQVVYSVGGELVKLNLQLPIIPTKFLTLVGSVDANTFFSMWKAIPGAPLKLQQVVQTETPMEVSNVQARISAVGLGVTQGLDPNPNNVVALASFSCESTGDTMLMLRMEIDPRTLKQYRITVASNDAALTSSTKEFLLKEINRV
jgi:AP-2 complex subunit alpha